MISFQTLTLLFPPLFVLLNFLGRIEFQERRVDIHILFENFLSGCGLCVLDFLGMTDLNPVFVE